MKEVIIYGCGSTRVEYPGKGDKELWSVNTCYHFLPEEDWYKDVDKLFIVDKISTEEFDYEELKPFRCIVAPLEHPELSNIELFPMKEVFEKFKTKFFSNAICYMMAYALLHEYERMWFYGIDMMTNSSYVVEKGGVEYWMGIAHAMGVPIINTKDSATGKTIDGRMYGFWGKKQECDLSEACSTDTRELIRTFPGLLQDESEEYVPDGKGDYDRKEQVIRHLVHER